MKKRQRCWENTCEFVVFFCFSVSKTGGSVKHWTFSEAKLLREATESELHFLCSPFLTNVHVYAIWRQFYEFTELFNIVTSLRVTGNTVVTEIPRRSQRGVIYHGNSLFWTMCNLSLYQFQDFFTLSLTYLSFNVSFRAIIYFRLDLSRYAFGYNFFKPPTTPPPPPHSPTHLNSMSWSHMLAWH